MIDLQIDPELKAWIDPLSPDEYALLESSILQDGCRDPLVVWSGYLLDGHNRYEICQKHGIEFAIFEKAGLTTKVDVKIWMIQNQMGKRNATDFARTALALKLKPLLEQRARERMQAGKVDPTQNSAEGVGETRQVVAKVAGVSHDTVRKVEKIIEKASAEVIEQVRTGEISIHAASKTINPPKPPARKVKEQIAAPPVEAGPAEDDEFESAGESTMILVDEDAYNEMKADYVRILAENTRIGEIFDADDRLKAALEAVSAALAEAVKQKAIADNAERTLASKSGEYVARAGQVTYWKNQAEKEKKRADKAEKELAKLEGRA